MIPRYSRKEMANIWSDKNKYNIWFEIEVYAIEAMEELGIVPKDTAKYIWDNGKFDIDSILEIEKQQNMM